MKALKKIAACLGWLLTFAVTSYSQEYLDVNKRYMKLTEVSKDENYGYSRKDPVKVGKEDAAMYAYLNSLKTPEGGRVLYIEVKQQDGSVAIVLTEKHRKVYFSTTEFQQPKAIAGFLFRTKDDILKVTEFPADSIKKVNSCGSKLYTEEELYPREVLKDALVTRRPPNYKNGLEGLEEYFFNAELKNKIDATELFKGAISFIVNCEGKAGNFKIATPGNSEELIIANQVLAIANRIPLDWQPGLMDGKPVDCSELLWYTVIDGKVVDIMTR